MVVTNDIFLRFAKNGRAVNDMKANTLKRLAQESFRLALSVTPPLKDIVIKNKESLSTAYAIIDYDIGPHRFVLEKDMNYVSLRFHAGGSAFNARLFICHVDNLELEKVKTDDPDT